MAYLPTKLEKLDFESVEGYRNHGRPHMGRHYPYWRNNNRFPIAIGILVALILIVIILAVKP